jgi:geranylgeranyl diphosphate synthase type II
MNLHLASIEEALERWLPPETAEPSTIHRAMRYSVLGGGKRIRPLLAMAAGEAIRADSPGIADVAATLEMIHTYSLIHDDLPDMDNDDYRRGRLTCHKVFGGAMAILAGDALCTLAFHVLASLHELPAETRVALVLELTTASGTCGGMIAGQVHDIEGERQRPTPELLDRIHRAKTGALIRAAVRMGGWTAAADPAQMRALTAYGEHLGLAFQIVDDVLDIEQSSAELGKTAGKDAAQEKITFPAVYGLDRSKQMAHAEWRAAIDAIEPLGERAGRLRELAELVVRRKT